MKRIVTFLVVVGLFNCTVVAIAKDECLDIDLQLQPALLKSDRARIELCHLAHKAQKAYEKDAFDQCQKFLNEALVVSLDHISILFDKASCQYMLREYDQSSESFIKVTQLSSVYNDAYYFTAASFDKCGKSIQARSWYKRYLASLIDPQSPCLYIRPSRYRQIAIYRLRLLEPGFDKSLAPDTAAYDLQKKFVDLQNSVRYPNERKSLVSRNVNEKPEFIPFGTIDRFTITAPDGCPQSTDRKFECNTQVLLVFFLLDHAE